MHRCLFCFSYTVFGDRCRGITTWTRVNAQAFSICQAQVKKIVFTCKSDACLTSEGTQLPTPTFLFLMDFNFFCILVMLLNMCSNSKITIAFGMAPRVQQNKRSQNGQNSSTRCATALKNTTEKKAFILSHTVSIASQATLRRRVTTMGPLFHSECRFA